MNLVLHQFKKDVRQFRLFLVIWSGLLLLDLAVNLGWIGQAIYTPERGFDVASNTWTAILPGVLWALVGALPSFVVLADSPARRDGFLATRPLPKGDLLFAKILFVGALVVTPWVLSELIHLTGRGMPEWVWVRGTLERLMFTVPVALGCGAFAALWPNVARWVRAIAGIFLGYALIGLVFSLAVHFLNLKFPGAFFHDVPAMVAAYTAMLAMLGFAVWHARAQRSAFKRWGGLFATLLVSQGLVSLWPWPGWKPSPENQAQAEAVITRAGLDISSRAVTLQREQNPEGDLVPQFNIGLELKLKNLRPDCVVEWSGKNARLARAGGGELPGDGKTVHARLMERNRWNFEYFDDELKAWASHFPEDVLFRQGSYNGGLNNWMNRLYLSKFNIPTSRAEMNEPLTLSAELEARVFQWRITADLPLTPGARTNTDFGSLEFISGRTRELTPSGQIYFLCRQIELYTAADLRCSTAFNGPLSRRVWMVFDPQTRTIWLPDSYSVVTYPRASHTALPEYYTYLGFSGRADFTAEELARCRLVALEKSWLGSVPEDIQSPAFTLDDKLPGNEGGMTANRDALPHGEFMRRVAALKVPAPAASRNEVSLYLLELLRLVEGQGRTLSATDPLVARVADFVPQHLDLLLSGLTAMNWNSSRLVLNAITLGAADSQKPDLIAALPRQPELAEVLLARGWVAEARPEIYQLLKSDRPLPLSALRAVAWFQDPETYPRLVIEFEASPTEAVDELLHNLGLDAQIEPIIARNWRQIKLANTPNSMFQSPFRLAMKHGDPSALERIYRVVNEKEADWRQQMYSLQSLPLQMAGLKSGEQQNPKSVRAWLQQYRPEDFVFNPARRQFVLRQNVSTNTTASISTGGGR